VVLVGVGGGGGGVVRGMGGMCWLWSGVGGMGMGCLFLYGGGAVCEGGVSWWPGVWGVSPHQSVDGFLERRDGGY